MNKKEIVKKMASLEYDFINLSLKVEKSHEEIKKIPEITKKLIDLRCSVDNIESRIDYRIRLVDSTLKDHAMAMQILNKKLDALTKHIGVKLVEPTDEYTLEVDDA